MRHQRTIGIVGFGQLGSWVATHIPAEFEIRAYDPVASHTPVPVRFMPLSEVLAADVVVLAIPLASYPEVTAQIAQHLRPETLLIDLCSVKTTPEKLLAKALPGHPQLLSVHPFFGPRSAANGLAGHTLVVTVAQGEAAAQVLTFCETKLGLRLVRMSAKAHDKLMAQVHALTFFVGRGLRLCDLPDTPLATPSYRAIADLIRLDKAESDELYHTIQTGNPYAQAMRRRLIRQLQAADAALVG